MPAIDIDRDAAHEAAQRELAKPIYPKESLTERISDWLNDLIYRIVQEGSSVPGGWFTVSVLAIILAVAIVVAVRVARRAMRTNRGGEPVLFDSHDLTAAQHRATAEQYAVQGNWAAAIRHRLRAIARQLEENGVLDPVPGRTATELATDAGAALPDLAADLMRAATAFNDVTYGERPGTEAAYRMIAELDGHLRSRTAASAAVAAPAAAADTWTAVR
ncbi:hypothetical protein CQY20_10965 [Mycolicibacterium agri]|uniref:Membrane protein n=1 Tax=Mycolicibacterium agri TaxID=36811 RepID=A0A2A7N5G7_MYCAG|nr:DUF4129 domain-containing protein [Mycolicibacterium agri]PEG39079.1 hypothetical protein CQY20_10965 [Mycolicibacterium agri]GFG54008.1 membrane protein [Mycolicibacterium agri]